MKIVRVDSHDMSGGRGPFDPFAGFGAFGSSGNLTSNVFGGRDPFDDPFFTNPFGGRDPFDNAFFTRPFGGRFESNVFGAGGNPLMGALPGSPFIGALPENPFMGALPGNPFRGAHARNPFSGEHPVNPFTSAHTSSFVDHQSSQPSGPRRGPIIEEVNSDDENDEKELENEVGESSRKHGRSSQESFVQDPDDEVRGRRSKIVHLPSDFIRQNVMSSQPQGQSYSFQSSTVSYGGTNGTCYTTSNMRRTGSDGLTFEESKEANSATGQAKHRVSRGINEKGHSVERKLNTDGRVDTMQTLHNLKEDELSGFEDVWEGAAKEHLPGARDWNNIIGARSRGGGFALPSIATHQEVHDHGVIEVAGDSGLHNQGKSIGDASNPSMQGPSRYRPRQGGDSGRN